MDQYTALSYELSRQVINSYSTSFSLSSRLFSASYRQHIYAIYGLTRIADEIVDTYSGVHARDLLDELQQDIANCRRRGFDPNPIVHAFVATATQYDITDDLVGAFFDSMRMDLDQTTHTQASYERYIYGSAAVIGLMCLKVFTERDVQLYDTLETGAKSLGTAYQKVNFLRDMATDVATRGRMYFPGVTLDTFDATTKQAIVDDIKADFAVAHKTFTQLPSGARRAIMVSYAYYRDLLSRLEITSPQEIMSQRISVPSWRKAWLMAQTLILHRWGAL